ncbi:bifunctional adenosylcobinamide kinase/adenosylcobinamide-phosphate guanylyltransferase [Lutibacter sp. B2]|nr:bifunctional adenosylcobinamide kinase/adenosylcobinamide-phosphate guanylyltransferase [Lutibacter sp. B2]
MSGYITLVTGGARSGKSNYAEKLAMDTSKSVAYVATAIGFDDGMKDRIKKHRESRPKEWTTYEGYKDVYKMIEEISRNHEVVLLDCITIMVTNLMFDHKDIKWDSITHEKIDEIEGNIEEQVRKLLQSVRIHKLGMILVTNELGMGIVPDNRISRIFRDIAGRINQMIAKEADEVYFTVSGLPMKLK